ncbi:hypothetical protein F0562_016329 [Nyssa sinensis]|uniref:Uncharacterized protein n=1 Tax=Nyssa sinensis TaxID=561372 RepID=A0A5J4ZP22_9ASTE|nr:hypothetical protein F0562_016329 [Nyssa sinensis]
MPRSCQAFLRVQGGHVRHYEVSLVNDLRLIRGKTHTIHLSRNANSKISKKRKAIEDGRYRRTFSLLSVIMEQEWLRLGLLEMMLRGQCFLA